MSVVECPEFRDLLLYLNSDLGEHDLPHRTKLTELIFEQFRHHYADMRSELKVIRHIAACLSEANAVIECTPSHLIHLRCMVPRLAERLHGGDRTLHDSR